MVDFVVDFYFCSEVLMTQLFVFEFYEKEKQTNKQNFQLLETSVEAHKTTAHARCRFNRQRSCINDIQTCTSLIFHYKTSFTVRLTMDSGNPLMSV